MSTDVAPERTEVPSAREVRRRSGTGAAVARSCRWGEVLSNAYVGLFCTVMVGAMAGNVVLNLRRLADETCTASCGEVRAAAPWLVALAVTLLALGLARLLGPGLQPARREQLGAEQPVDRGALLRPGWVRTTVLTSRRGRPPAGRPGGPRRLRVGTRRSSTWSPAARPRSRASAWPRCHRCASTGLARWLTWLVAVALWAVLGLSATQELGGCRTCRRVGPGGRGRAGGRGRPGSRGARPSRSARSRDASSARPSTSPPACRARCRRSTSA